ncbi:hypothetical protein TWF694_005333 [Orbilia ellipsospora]|uniref:lytic cellulose monooxygenase (C4-dehydrogenating) n=1 Tax=Orbilia ellipsospora TaxID=2528407 RepID=A0AAV9WSS6_9PEZI
MRPLVFFTLFSTLATTVLGHAYVKEFIVDERSYPGFDPFEPLPQQGIIDQPWDVTYRHRANTDSYVPSGTGDETVCRKSARPVPTVARARAGAYVTFRWSRWQINHIGPIITYLADCKGNCGNVIGARLKWFKIDEAGFNGMLWATELLQRQGKAYTIQLPKALKDGQYLMRHEMLAYQNKFKSEPMPNTQIYPVCLNIEIVGGTGKVVPQAVPLQGYYGKANLPRTEIQRGVQYQFPGPPLVMGLGNTPSLQLNPGLNKNPNYSTFMETLVEPTDETPNGKPANAHLNWYARVGATPGRKLKTEFPMQGGNLMMDGFQGNPGQNQNQNNNNGFQNNQNNGNNQGQNNQQFQNNQNNNGQNNQQQPNNQQFQNNQQLPDNQQFQGNSPNNNQQNQNNQQFQNNQQGLNNQQFQNNQQQPNNQQYQGNQGQGNQGQGNQGQNNQFRTNALPQLNKIPTSNRYTTYQGQKNQNGNQNQNQNNRNQNQRGQLRQGRNRRREITRISAVASVSSR